MNIEDSYYAQKKIICENEKLTSYDASFVIDNDKTVKEAISDFNSSNNFILKNYILISL